VRRMSEPRSDPPINAIIFVILLSLVFLDLLRLFGFVPATIIEIGNETQFVQIVTVLFTFTVSFMILITLYTEIRQNRRSKKNQKKAHKI
jgi:amino acid transporter